MKLPNISTDQPTLLTNNKLLTCNLDFSVRDVGASSHALKRSQWLDRLKINEKTKQEENQVINVTNTPLASNKNDKPWIDQKGNLIIPFDSNPKYHYWAGGQSLKETLDELNAPPEVYARYV